MTAAAASPSRLAPLAEGGVLSTRLLLLVSVATLTATALVWIYAALELRPLFADGFHYLLRILERENFWLEAPARRTVELIRQLPVLAMVELGIGGLETVGIVFGISISLLPLLLVALCWPALPRERKYLFAFPLLHYFAGTAGAAFAPITEGATAAAYFWLLLFLVLFRPARGGALAAIAGLAFGTMLLHEGMLLLAPVLVAASLWRARHESRRGARFVFAALAAWFAIVAVVQANFILNPGHPENRALFISAVISFWWLFGLWGTLNLPALFGIAALALLAIFVLWGMRAPSRARLWTDIVCTIFGIACIAAVIDAMASDRMYAAQAQFNARNHSILISVPLGAVAVFVAARPAAARLAFRAAVVLSAWLAAASALWHIDSVRRWSDYVGVFREVIAANRGLVAWEDVVAALPPPKARLFEGMSHFWIEPTMSIVLAPGGKVAAIIAARRAAHWYPFDARNPAELPRSRFWTFDDYLATLNR